MRTNIAIAEKLMGQVLKHCNFRTKKEAVEEGLKLLIQRKNQEHIKKLRGKVTWEGDLSQMRTGKN